MELRRQGQLVAVIEQRRTSDVLRCFMPNLHSTPVISHETSAPQKGAQNTGMQQATMPGRIPGGVLRCVVFSAVLLPLVLPVLFTPHSAKADSYRCITQSETLIGGKLVAILVELGRLTLTPHLHAYRVFGLATANGRGDGFSQGLQQVPQTLRG